MFKRLTSLLLIFIISISLAVSASARAVILDASQVDASAFTTVAPLSAKLKKVFSGQIGLYADKQFTKKVSLPLGISMSTSQQFYVPNGKSVTVGKQCFIYANAVYNDLFGEAVGRGENLRYSQVVLAGGNNVSYEKFKKAGITTGAYMRTTEKTDASYDGNSGHSMIILYYDAESITFLEGNANNKGLIRITIESWQEFNKSKLQGKGRYLCHIIQPTAKHFESLYIDTAWVFEDINKTDWFYQNGAVNFAYANGIFQGITTTRFEPNTALTRGMLVTVLGRMRGITTDYVNENSFTDVPSSQYYAPYVCWASDEGLVKGFEDGSFRPDEKVTREQLSTVMALFCNAPQVQGELFDDDAEIAEWARPYVYACKEMGIISGKPQNEGYVFDGKSGATRAEVATILYNIEKM